MSRSTGIGALCCVLVLLIASGCETTGGTKGPTGDLMSRAVADYEAGRYETASGGAEEVMRSASGPQLENAAYLAGLSAYRLGRSDQAERRLMTAAGSNRPETAGKAKAMLGIIRLDQNRPREAIDLFEAAAGMLTGSDAERAREHAQLARSRAGEPDSPGIHHYASAAGAGQFALQVGAFRDADGAGRAAREAQTIADRAGLGPVRIVPGTDEQGGRLYLVQFGRFASRGAAATARAEIGTLEYIVAPLAGMTALR